MAYAWIICIVLACICARGEAGPKHGHSHSHPHSHPHDTNQAVDETEEWNITLAVKSGSEDYNWAITMEDRKRSKNVALIAKALDWYTNNKMSKDKQLSPSSGYKGYEIHRAIKGGVGGVPKTTILPRCTLPTLEKFLLLETAPELTVSAYHKNITECSIQMCKFNKNKTPNECFEKAAPLKLPKNQI